MANGDRWAKRSTIYTAIGVVVTIVFGVVALVTPEIRCALHLDSADKCRQATSSDATTDGLKTIVDAPPDPNLPYVVNAPAPHQVPGTDPYVELDIHSIVNRGRPVPVTLSGSGFFTNTHVQIEWYSSNGGTYMATGAESDDRGLFRVTLLWLPLRDEGISGNNGAWKMQIKDLTSGGETAVQLTVTSDNHTPPPDEWPTRQTWNVKPLGSATLSAGTSGYLCEGSGAQSLVHAEGFTPEAGLQVDYIRPDGQRVASSTTAADGIGSIDNLILYWKTQNCSPQSEFKYQVVVTELTTGRQAKSSLIFTTTHG